MILQLHDLLRATAQPSRLRILNLLQKGELCVSELQAVLGLPQSTVSRHLATLRHAGLVIGTPRGTRTLYTLAPAEHAQSKAFWRFLANGCCTDKTFQADLVRLEQRRAGGTTDG